MGFSISLVVFTGKPLVSHSENFHSWWVFPMFPTSILVYSGGDQATPPRLPSLNFKDFPLSTSPETVAYYAYDLPEPCSAATVEEDLSSAAVCVPAASCGNSGVVVVPGRPESLCLFFLHGFGPEESGLI